MEIVKLKCANCSKYLYIQEDHIREKMFCTLGCMDLYSSEKTADHINFH
ncbi:MAG: hypothetical protein KKA10_13280 [Euryarchaeota archaeon]|nr:hypothetical protein [Euryarchaeota archaeon]MCG2736345.1 hypothetical protein [Candidatus Methanoperedenaceae archaeon]